MRRTLTILAALMSVAAIIVPTAPALAAVGGGGGGGAVCDGFASGDRIRMYDSCFAGTAQLVDPESDTVTVENNGQMPHTLTAVDGSFDVLLQAGETATVDLPGNAVIPVYCTLHGTDTGAGMAGVIVRHTTGDVTATADESAAAVDLTPASSSDGGRGDGLAVVALVVAGLAAVFTLLSFGTILRIRRGTGT